MYTPYKVVFSIRMVFLIGVCFSIREGSITRFQLGLVFLIEDDLYYVIYRAIALVFEEEQNNKLYTTWGVKWENIVICKSNVCVREKKR